MNYQIKNEDEMIKFNNNNFEFFNKSIIYFF